jgi:hypothetical protein
MASVEVPWYLLSHEFCALPAAMGMKVGQPNFVRPEVAYFHSHTPQLTLLKVLALVHPMTEEGDDQVYSKIKQSLIVFTFAYYWHNNIAV